MVGPLDTLFGTSVPCLSNGGKQSHDSSTTIDKNRESCSDNSHILSLNRHWASEMRDEKKIWKKKYIIYENDH